ncbi:ATP-binding protein [Pseudomonas aeruginosa]|uniref:ATP-binding protein n=1 Tax=Pseudomonas aeruginosa TaxID=287 RepID=UPI001F29AE44|nr:ATP-binding protein [Pseudomonas aeruginosa]
MDAQQQLQRLLTGSGENEVVEFKEAKNSYDFDKLGRYFSALSNEANLKGLPSAWLVFGVKDNQQVVGTRYREQPKQLQSLKKEVADKVSQRLTFIEIHTVLHPAGRVLLLEIPAAPKACRWLGKGTITAAMANPSARCRLKRSSASATRIACKTGVQASATALP